MKKLSLVAVAILAMGLVWGCGSDSDRDSESDAQIETPKDGANQPVPNPDANEANTALTNEPKVDGNAPTEPKKEIGGSLIAKPGEEGWTSKPIPLTVDQGPKMAQVGTSSTPPKIPTPPDINKPITPLEVFQKIDSAYHSLANYKVSFNLQGQFPEGKGTYANESVIKDANRFRISYARLIKSPVPHLEEYITTQRNGKTITFSEGKITDGRVVVDKITDLNELPKTITHYLASGFATKAKPMEGIYRAAQKQGWTMKVEKKAFDVGIYQRIYMESPKGQQPEHRYEFTVNPNEKMPTNIKMEILDPKAKKNTKVELIVAYARKSTPVTEDDLKISTRVEEFKGMASDADIDKVIDKQKKQDPQKNAPEKAKGN